MLKITLFFLISLCLLACDRPNPEPHKLDPIYSELEREAKAVQGEIDKAKKDLEGFLKEHEAVVPQTGQIKYAQKRVDETRNRIQKLEQLKLYWDLRVKSREEYAKTEYMKAYNKKEPWPPPEEYQSYLTMRKFEQSPRHWDAKQRFETAKAEFEMEQKKKAALNGHKDAPKGH